MISDVDILIVGAGPAGISVALHLLKKDPLWAKRITILEKSAHPRAKLCGGGITHIGQNVLARLGVPFDVPHVEIGEVRLDFEELSISFLGSPVMRVVDRAEFDCWLSQIAIDCGVTLKPNEVVTAISQQTENVEVTTNNGTYRAKVVVAADGSRSTIRKCLGWEANERRANLIDVLTEVDHRTHEAFIHRRATFDFSFMVHGKLQGYYWDFPSFVRQHGIMNRGLFDSRVIRNAKKANLRNLLEKALSKRKIDTEGLSPKGHPIIWWDRTSRFSMNRVLLVGDAAGVDPLVGEGISFALGYGEVAADTLHDAFESSDYSLETYKIRLLRHGLFEHLEKRARFARFLYSIRSRWLYRIVWRLAPIMVRRTEWKDKNHDPGEYPKFSLVSKVRSGIAR